MTNATTTHAVEIDFYLEVDFPHGSAHDCVDAVVYALADLHDLAVVGEVEELERTASSSMNRVHLAYDLVVDEHDHVEDLVEDHIEAIRDRLEIDSTFDVKLDGADSAAN